MEFLPKEIEAYAEAHTEPESDLLRRLNRDTHAKVMRPRMLSGHLQGRLLALFSRLVRPRYILEIGTYTGYSALCLCEGLAEDGTLITLDSNEELEDFTRDVFARSEYDSQIDYRIGNALDVLPTLSGPFDLVFIDADKVNYSRYYDLILDKLNTGGIIMADNVLWSGKVAVSYTHLDVYKRQPYTPCTIKLRTSLRKVLPRKSCPCAHRLTCRLAWKHSLKNQKMSH